MRERTLKDAVRCWDSVSDQTEVISLRKNSFISTTFLLDYYGKPELGFPADCAGTVITGILQMQVTSFSLQDAGNQVVTLSNMVTSQ